VWRKKIRFRGRFDKILHLIGDRIRIVQRDVNCFAGRLDVDGSYPRWGVGLSGGRNPRIIGGRIQSPDNPPQDASQNGILHSDLFEFVTADEIRAHEDTFLKVPQGC
jgi:hypothetical protein